MTIFCQFYYFILIILLLYLCVKILLLYYYNLLWHYYSMLMFTFFICLTLILQNHAVFDQFYLCDSWFSVIVVPSRIFPVRWSRCWVSAARPARQRKAQTPRAARANPSWVRQREALLRPTFPPTLKPHLSWSRYLYMTWTLTNIKTVLMALRGRGRCVTILPIHAVFYF